MRFKKSGYGHVAVRAGALWETSSTQSGMDFIDEMTSWEEMWPRGRYFELAVTMGPIMQPAEHDKRLMAQSICWP